MFLFDDDNIAEEFIYLSLHLIDLVVHGAHKFPFQGLPGQQLDTRHDSEHFS